MWDNSFPFKIGDIEHITIPVNGMIDVRRRITFRVIGVQYQRRDTETLLWKDIGSPIKDTFKVVRNINTAISTVTVINRDMSQVIKLEGDRAIPFLSAFIVEEERYDKPVTSMFVEASIFHGYAFVHEILEPLSW